MKKQWTAPELEVLDIKETMAGPGLANVDAIFVDDDEVGYLHSS